MWGEQVVIVVCEGVKQEGEKNFETRILGVYADPHDAENRLEEAAYDIYNEWCAKEEVDPADNDEIKFVNKNDDLYTIQGVHEMYEAWIEVFELQ